MNKNKTKINQINSESIYVDPGIDNVIEAISNQKSGQKTVLIFRHPIQHTDSFQLTETFPFYFFEIKKAAKKSRQLKKLFLLCPHLVQAQKVIYIKSGAIKWVAKITDIFFKNQFNEKSAIINQKTPENLSFLKFNNLHGIVFHEYKINVSRLFIELLKYFESIGGKIVVNKKFDASKISNIIEGTSNPKSAFLTNIKSPSNFALVIQNKKNSIRLFENNNTLQIDSKTEKTKILTKNEIQKELENIVLLNPKSIKEIEFSLFLSTKTVANLLNTVNKRLPGSFPNAAIKDNYELSLEKFDIAKQTGITYPEFKILFHRYGTGIDEMIDEAYEKMNEIRDSKKIWDQVEIRFQQKNEWKV